MIFGLFGGNQPAQTPQELGYKRSAGMDYLSNYVMDNKNYFDKDDAQDFSTGLFDAVEAGSLDRNEALAMMNARTQPGSDYFKTDQYKDLLGYKMPEDRVRGLIGDAYATNYFRAGTPEEINELYAMASDAGVLNDPNELRNFTTSTLARLPEGEDKRPFDQLQLEKSAELGMAARDSEGRNVGAYKIFGDDTAMYDQVRNFRKQTGSFVSNYLNSMGAKGRIA